MKKVILLAASAALALNVEAQQWNGSPNTTNNIYRGGDLTVIENSIARVSIGAAWGGNPIWGRGYVGFNLRRENTGMWSFLNDGASNDGAVIYTSGNNLMFALKPSTGAFSATNFTDAQVVNSVLMRINSSVNTLTFGKNDPHYIHTVSIGPAWGGSGMWGEGYVGFNLERNNVGTWDFKDDGANNGSFVMWAGAGGEFNFSSKNSTGASSGSLSDAQVVNNRIMQITNDRKVVIGDVSNINTGTNYGYRLYVDRGIITERVKVAIETSADWSDFVFAENYKLRPLTDVETFIAENKHLPDVPSAAEVVGSGIDVAKMDATLLQKIEELTLYIIELKKENEKLNKRVANLER